MARDINFLHFIDSPAIELPTEFADCVQVQNVSGRTLEVVDDVFCTPLSTFIANSENKKIQNLIDKKTLKVRPFTTSSSAEALEAPVEPKKKRTKKGQSVSSPQPLEGAVAELAAVINGESSAVPAEDKNMEQLVETDSAVGLESNNETTVEGSPETDNQSV